MKKFNLVLFLITTIFFSTNAQTSKSANNIYCDFGITYEISNNPSWGYGEPVVLTVQPYSPADEAGLKIGDIIMEVNSIATYLRNYQTIGNWLSNDQSQQIRLTIRNLDTYFKEYTIQRECKSANSLSEFNLATAYSFYSLESTNQRAFSIPIKVDPNSNADFSDYHTFDFVAEDTNAPAIDNFVNAQIEKTLVARGLKRDVNDPEMMIQAYYSLQPNVKYDAGTLSQNSKTWRYDSQTKEMIALPLLSAEDVNAETKGQYIIELGIRFFDKKYIDENKLTQIWDARTHDFLTAQMTIQEYATIHAPLVLMQYPYSKTKTVAKYIVNFKAFNYTGLNYASNNLSLITYVDPNSPAEAVGIKAGDIVQKINGVKFDYTTEELDNGYKRFIVKSMALRDKRTRFIDANGFPDCMYWDKAKYPEIIDLFNKQNIYTPSFSYLYSFEKFIPGGLSSGDVSIDIKTPKGQNKSLPLKPQLQESVVVLAL